MEEEVEWVKNTGINCILSDAAFLAWCELILIFNPDLDLDLIHMIT